MPHRLPIFHSLCASFLCWSLARNSLFICKSLLSCLSDYLFIECNRKTLNINQFSFLKPLFPLGPYPIWLFQANFWRSQNLPFWSPGLQAWFLPSPLSSRSGTPTVFGYCRQSHPWHTAQTSFSLLVSMMFSRAPHVIGLSVIWVRNTYYLLDLPWSASSH